MATQVSYVKNGISIQCAVDKFPAPRPQAAWPMPLFPCTENSLLVLALVGFILIMVIVTVKVSRR